MCYICISVYNVIPKCGVQMLESKTLSIAPNTFEIVRFQLQLVRAPPFRAESICMSGALECDMLVGVSGYGLPLYR